MKNNLCIYVEEDNTACIFGAYMQYNDTRDQMYVVLFNSYDRCDLTYPFYISSIETLILHSMRARARAQ